MLVDEDRQLYKAMGLTRSVSKVWAISSLFYYAEKKAASRKLVPMLENDDVHQLGGNFIIDSAGKMALIYGSKMSTDRPSVDFLLNCLKSNSKAT